MEYMNNLRVIQYLGSKLNLLPQIKVEIDRLCVNGDTILDLFAGTGIVSEYLKTTYKIYANDIQTYSSIMCELLLTNNSIRSNNSLIKRLYESDEYKNNYQVLMNRFNKLVEFEEKAVYEEDEVALVALSESRTFFNECDNTNCCSENLKSIYKELQDLFSDNCIVEYQKDIKRFPYSLFSIYYHGSYFSIKQCIEIDSLRYAIDCISKNEHDLRVFYLNALMHAISEVVSSVGKHFAQPIKIINKNGVVKKSSITRFLKDKKKHINIYMYEFERNIKTLMKDSNYNNKVFCENGIDLLKTFRPGDIQLTYLDPPYTIDHYSRFYHILETLILYDYPNLEKKKKNGKYELMRGRYRDDRFQSNFCIQKKVVNEFDSIFSELSRIESKAILSYSDTDEDKQTRSRVIELDELINLAKKYYKNVEVKRINHEYKKLNNSKVNVKVKEDSEILLICF